MDKDKPQAGCMGTALRFEQKFPSAPLCYRFIFATLKQRTAMFPSSSMLLLNHIFSWYLEEQTATRSAKPLWPRQVRTSLPAGEGSRKGHFGRWKQVLPIFGSDLSVECNVVLLILLLGQSREPCRPCPGSPPSSPTPCRFAYPLGCCTSLLL